MSSVITARTLSQEGTPSHQAELLKCFRADSIGAISAIVADLKPIELADNP